MSPEECAATFFLDPIAQHALATAIHQFIAEERETGRARFFVTYPWWRHRLAEVPDDVVDILLDFAKQDRKEDFMFMAGSCGVPGVDQGVLWDGTRRRLGL